MAKKEASIVSAIIGLMLLPIFAYMDLEIIYAFSIAILSAFGILALVFYLIHVVGWANDFDIFDVQGLVDLSTSEVISDSLSGFFPAVVNLAETLWDIVTDVIPTIVQIVEEIVSALESISF
jgi:hypothetical protein